MENTEIHHALKVDNDICIGCGHCMSSCPTDAIRVRRGRTIIFSDRCIDCGKCLKGCPKSAIRVEQDDFSTIFNFQRRVALVPAVLKGQFPEDISVRQIYSVLLDMGFTDVCEVESIWRVYNEASTDYIQDKRHIKPLISSFCPAVLRLIQIRFPSLLDHVIPMKAPVDIAALYHRKRLTDSGIKDEDIGMFYVTPCAAKISAVKTPAEHERHVLNGLINMDYIYNKAYRRIKQGKMDMCRISDNEESCDKGILWSLTNGESEYARGRSLAIDGIYNVIDFLENLENEEISDIDFLELRSCDQSCAGGVLTTRNRFLTAERLKNRAERYRAQSDDEKLSDDDQLDLSCDYLMENIMLGEIAPKPMMKLDEDIGKALSKMKRIQKINDFLPGVDCRICGSPNCHTLAEDIAMGQATIHQCIFVRMRMMEKGKMKMTHAVGIMDNIWGRERLDVNHGVSKSHEKELENNEG